MSQEPQQHLTADESMRNAVAQRIAHLDALDPVIHQPTRLYLMAVLAWSQDAVRFQTLAEQFHLSKSLLSTHLTTLHRAGFVTIQKVARERYVVTTIELTSAGRAAFARYRAAMRSALTLDEALGAPGR